MSDGFFACGMCVYVFEWQIYFDEFFAVFLHGVWWFVVVNRYRIIYDVEGDLHRVIYRFIALAFDSSPIKGEGELVGLACCMPHPVDTALKPV